MKLYHSIEKPGRMVSERKARRERKREAKAQSYIEANRRHGTSGRKGRKQ